MSGSTNKAKATLISRVALFFLSPLFPWLMAFAATLAVASTIDVADDFSWSAQGPGLTFDEGFNIEVGVYLVKSYLAAGISGLHPETQLDIYRDPFYNPDHPPLGRILLGLSNEAFHTWAPSSADRPYVASASRLASAIEFGILVLLIGLYTRKWFGPTAGNAAMIAFCCMPRCFAHAHIASLETCTSLMYVWFLLRLADAAAKRRQFAVTLIPSVLLGLAFLTKIHAVFLLPVIVVWGFYHWGWRACAPLLGTVLIAGIVFFIGWPWLWIDPWEHLGQYFGRTTDRTSLNCFYMGQKFADRAVPWHYPFVMFLTTVPAGLLVAGFIGMFNRTGDENTRLALFDVRTQLLFGAWLLPLIVFALPGVTVYDGDRLFLMCFPLFAVFAGLGADRILQVVGRKYGSMATVGLLSLTLVGPVYNLITLHPCQMSYYSELTGGLWKADELGFESTYWGDSLTPDFVREIASQIPENGSVDVAPVLHPLQLDFMKQGSWFRNRPDIQLKAYDDQKPDPSPYVLVIHRKADPWASLSPPPEGTEVLGQVERQGVVLAEFLRLPSMRGE